MRASLTLNTVTKKVLVPTFALLCLLTTTLGAGLIWQNSAFAEQMMEARGRSMADFMAKVGRGYVNLYNLQALDTLVVQAMKEQDILFAAFYDDKGEVMTQLEAPPQEPEESPTQLRYTRNFADDDGRSLGSMKVYFSKKQVLTNTRRMVGFMIGGIAGMLLLAMIGMALLVRWVLRPIHELTRVAQNVVRRGDLRQQLQQTSNDEIGELSGVFGEMVKNLRDALAQLQTSSQSLDGSVGHLTGVTTEQNQMLVRQATALRETGVTAEEIKQTSLVAAEKAQLVIEVTNKAEQVSEEGDAAVERTIVGFGEIRSRVQEISRKIGDLGERARQIGEITLTVKDLADQSNMLALNAAIEAVRAGEAGKGFAVVAREVRNLADQSIHATRKVREILEEITHAISEAVAITQAGMQRIESGMVEVNASGDSLRQLSAIVGENSKAVRQIASAVSQQNAGIQQIFGAITELQAVMDESLKRVQSTADATTAIGLVSQRAAEIVKGYVVS